MTDSLAESRLEFEHVTIDEEGRRDPWGKSVGDIDGDGLIDIVVEGHGSDDLYGVEDKRLRIMLYMI